MAPTRRDVLVSLAATAVVGACNDAGPTAKDSADTAGADTGSLDTVDTGDLDTGGDTGTEVPEECVTSDLPDPLPDQTAPQPEGPNYREGAPIRSELNVAGLDGAALSYRGRLVYLDGTPVVGALIEVWHADPVGEYDMETAEYQSRGGQITGESGEFCFLTTYPPHYEDPEAGTLVSHMHVKVWLDGQEWMTTQTYFSDDPLLLEKPVNPANILEVLGDETDGYSVEALFLIDPETPTPEAGPA